jgi:hypothetical protein
LSDDKLDGQLALTFLSPRCRTTATQEKLRIIKKVFKFRFRFKFKFSEGQIQNQYNLAFISILLNIAEGAGKQTGKDQIAETVAMLTSLAKCVAADRVNEETVSYST